jgi:hypothetical protein
MKLKEYLWRYEWLFSELKEEIGFYIKLMGDVIKGTEDLPEDAEDWWKMGKTEKLVFCTQEILSSFARAFNRWTEFSFSGRTIGYLLDAIQRSIILRSEKLKEEIIAPVKVVLNESLVSNNPKWKEELEQFFTDISKNFKRQVGIEFQIKEIIIENYLKSYDELTKSFPEKDVIIVWLKKAKEASGYAGMIGEGRNQVMAKILGFLDIESKITVLHEIIHIYGGIHLDEDEWVDSIMKFTIPKKTWRIDAKNLKIISKNKYRFQIKEPSKAPFFILESN